MLSLVGKRLLNCRKCLVRQEIRTYLSNAYGCKEVWDQRKRPEIFQKADYDDLFHQLDRCFQNGRRISILDVDIFLNGIKGESYQNELEDVIFRLRQNPEAVLLAERTMHAVVKFYIEAGKKKDLLHILSNRLSYGIFLDDFAANMLMDSFLKENDVTSAAKTAVLVMLQEDFSHPITTALSILSCIKYLKSDDVWELPKPEEVDPDEDEIKVRVAYLRTPYFDDHFDIVEPNQLIGKTLFMAGSATTGPLASTSQILGLILWEKFKAAEELLKNGAEILDDGAELAANFVNTKPKTDENSEITEEKTQLLMALEKAKKVPGVVEKFAEDAAISAIAEHESADVKNLSQLYKNWEKERENDLQKELFESKKRQAIADIAKTRETLSKEEEIIFYFDKEDQWDLRVESKEEEIRAVELENASQKKSKKTDSDYIPPDVGQKRA